MTTPSGPQGLPGPGGPYPPEGYGPPPSPPPAGPRQHPGGPAPQYGPPQPRSEEGVGLSPQQQAQSGRSPQRDKGFFGSLLDINFDHPITTKMIKLVYVLALVGVSLITLIVAWYGLAFLRWNTTLGVMTLLAAPIMWLFWAVAVRMALEFLINQFKITEYLRILKEQGDMRR